MPSVGSLLAAPATYDPSKLAWTAAFLAWVLAVPMYVVTTAVATVAHEGGHAIVAKLFFRKVLRIELNPGGAGKTTYEKPAWLFHILITLAGYLGPSMFGLLAVVLLLHGATEAVLWASLVFLALMLFAVRGRFGLFLVPALMAAIFLVAIKTQPPLRVLLTHVWVWFLLIAPVEDMLVYLRRKYYVDSGSDTGVLQRLTRLSSEIWAVLLLIGTIVALVYGGSLLLRHAS